MVIRESETLAVLKNIYDEEEMAYRDALKCLLVNQIEILKKLEILLTPTASFSQKTVTGNPLGEGEIVIGAFKEDI